MKRIACFFRGHAWKMSPFKALNSTSLRPDFICDRCRKFRSGDDWKVRKAGDLS